MLHKLKATEIEQKLVQAHMWYMILILIVFSHESSTIFG
jgi:hypothetical protein